MSMVLSERSKTIRDALEHYAVNGLSLHYECDDENQYFEPRDHPEGVSPNMAQIFLRVVEMYSRGNVSTVFGHVTAKPAFGRELRSLLNTEGFVFTEIPKGKLRTYAFKEMPEGNEPYARVIAFLARHPEAEAIIPLTISVGNE